MGVFKRCDCETKDKNGCSHEWWGSFKLNPNTPQTKVNLSKWGTGEKPETKTDAKKVYARFEQAVRDGKFRKAGESEIQQAMASSGASIEAVVKRYIAEYLDAEEIKGDERGKVTRFATYYAERAMASITTADVLSYRGHLRLPNRQVGKAKNGKRTIRPTEKVIAKATVLRHMARLRHLWNWAIGVDLVTATPFRKGNRVLIKFSKKDVVRRHRRFDVDENEEQRLMNAAPYEWQVLIAIALDSGMRQGEMWKLRVRDLKVKPGWIELPGPITKSGATRYVPVTGRSKPLFAALTAGKASTDFVIGGAFQRDQWDAIVAAAGLTDFLWHDLRHEFASRLAFDVEPKRAISEIQALLGHSSPEVTKVYINAQDRDLAAAVAGLDALAVPVVPPRIPNLSPMGKKRLALVKRAS